MLLDIVVQVVLAMALTGSLAGITVVLITPDLRRKLMGKPPLDRFIGSAPILVRDLPVPFNREVVLIVEDVYKRHDGTEYRNKSAFIGTTANKLFGEWEQLPGFDTIYDLAVIRRLNRLYRVAMADVDRILTADQPEAVKRLREFGVNFTKREDPRVKEGEPWKR